MNEFIYLDAAASYQKDAAVINAQVDFLQNHYANSGRGICARAAWVDNMVVNARQRVAKFMNAKSENIVFTHGTTDSFNQIVRMLNLSSGAVVAVSDLDHHSARLPFMMCGVNVVVCPLDGCCDIDVKQIPCADVVVITAMSNVLGRAQNVPEIIRKAREKNPNVITVVDAAQFVVHEKIDVDTWNADFVCWSAHKIGADTGLGIMYVRNPERFQPGQFGGGMVNVIDGDKIVFNNPPDVFEAGTLPLTQIAGLGVAIEKIEKNRPDLNLIKYMYDELEKMSRIKLLSGRDAAVLSFVVDEMHVLDFGALIGARGVCLRVGNMCATWIHQHLGIGGSVRVSVGAYNTMQQVQQVIMYIKDILK